MNLIKQFEPDVVQETTSGAVTANKIVQLGDGRVGLLQGCQDVASGGVAAYITSGVVEVAKANGVTGSKGAVVYLDTDSTPTLVTSPPTTGFVIGVLHEDLVSANLHGLVRLNQLPRTTQFVHTVGASPSTSVAIKTGFASLTAVSVQIRRSNRIILTSYDITVSGGTVTIANVSSNYTLTEGDVITLTVTGTP